MKNKMKLTVPALSINEGFVRSTVAAFCVSLGPSLEEVNDIKTAVSEAVTNSIVHAYGDEGGEIEIEATLKESTVDIVVRDFGKGIANVAEAMEPFFTTRSQDERSGMGFVVMQAFMDDVKVKSEVGVGTEICLHKRFEEAKC